MNRMILRRDDVVVGVDTHKDEHAAVLLDGHGGTLTELVVPATTNGSAQLLGVAVVIAGVAVATVKPRERAPAPV